MSRVWICADTHWGHNNICKYRSQFSSEEEHSSIIMDNILTSCGKRDSLWLLGDICFTKDSLKYLKAVCDRVETVKIVLGNHCAQAGGMTARDYLEHCNDVYGITTKKNCWLTHAPIHPSELRGRWNIFGHIHDKVINDSRYACVSMEQIDYKPVLLMDVVNELRSQNENTKTI